MAYSIAQLLTDGRLCEHCGGDFREKPLGYPRACSRCLPDQTKTLPGIKFECFNHGLHHRYAGRFHFWPSKEKWWDAATGVKGKGEKAFVAHVKRVLAEHAAAHIDYARQYMNAPAEAGAPLT